MPPALLTAATTSRQWLKAKIGYSIPSWSQSLVRMASVLFAERSQISLWLSNARKPEWEPHKPVTGLTGSHSELLSDLVDPVRWGRAYW